MAKIIIIAAIGKKRELGKENKLIWHLKEDLKFFKENTSNHKIVMGYNTFVSLGRLLPNREHIVLTHKDLEIEEVKVFHEFAELLNYLNTLDEEVYIIGGASVYKMFIKYADELLLTEINDSREADVYFPEFNRENYDRELIKAVKEEDIEYIHVRYRRKNER